MGRLTLLETTGDLAPSVEKYQLRYIMPYHREIARRVVLGEKQHEIATDLHLNEGRLSIICNSPLFKNEVARLEAMREAGVQDVTMQIDELAPVMLEVMERIAMYGAKESNRIIAAQDLLDRSKYTKVKKFEGSLTTETHEQKLERLTGDRVDNAVDVTPTKVGNNGGNGDGKADNKEEEVSA